MRRPRPGDAVEGVGRRPHYALDVADPIPERATERDFSSLVEQVLGRMLGANLVEREPRLGPARPDFIAHLKDGRIAIVEVKLVTPTTASRLDGAADQLRRYGKLFVDAFGGPTPDLILVVSGTLPLGRLERLNQEGVKAVIDGRQLRAFAPDLPWPDAGTDGHAPDRQPMAAATYQRLASELDAIGPGRAEWAGYQRVVRDILAATLSPPLGQPLDENANLSGVNRRDIILPNYAVTGIWKFLRDHYEAHFVVVDAKNFVGGIKKKEILQVANYLSPHGAGLFGIIACRNAEDRSAEVTRREQWVVYRKLIIILNDADLKQMLAISETGEDAAIVVRQKIEDFRLGF